MHHDSQLTPQTPLPVAISNTQSEKEANICQYSLDNRKNQEAIRAEKQRGADNKWKHGERFFFFFFFFLLRGGFKSRPRKEVDRRTNWASPLPLPAPDSIRLKTFGLLFWLCYFYSHLSCWSYLQNVSREWRGLEVSWNPARWIVFFGCGWSIAALFGPVQKNSGVGELESALPLGNKTTTHTFSDASYTHVHFSCVRFQQTGTDSV